MIPLMAIGSVSKAVDAISSGASWVSKELSSSSQDDSKSKPTSTGTDNPMSFASVLAAQGLSVSGNQTPSASAIPTTPNLSATGAAHAGSGSGHRVGHHN